MVITYKAAWEQQQQKKVTKTTLCTGFSLRRRTAGGRTERKRERKRKLRGGAVVTEEQRSRGRKGKREEFRSVLWIKHAGPGMLIHLWFGRERKEMAGEKGQLGDRWARARSGEVKTGSIVIGFHNFLWEHDWNFVTSLSRDSRLNFLKGVLTGYARRFTHCSAGWMWSKTTRL